VILPNGPLANGTIINFSKAEKRKIEVIIPIRYGDNLDGIMSTLLESFLLEDKILKEPEPSIQLTQLGEEKASLSIQVWVKNVNFNVVSNTVNAIVYRLVSSEGFLNLKNQND
jgi:small conductance mechanosensitive channel